MRTPRILMCPPDFYGIEYEINPWMNRSRTAAIRSSPGDSGTSSAETLRAVSARQSS